MTLFFLEYVMSELEKESRFEFVWYEYGYQLLDGWFDWNWFWTWFWWIWPPLTPDPVILAPAWLLDPFPLNSFCPCCCWWCCCCCCWCCWWWWCILDWLMERLGAIWPNSFISGFSSNSSTQLDAGFSPWPSSVSLERALTPNKLKQFNLENLLQLDPSLTWIQLLVIADFEVYHSETNMSVVTSSVSGHH